MEQESLEELGFTHAEAKVYLALLKLGSVKVGRIIEKSGLQSSTTHNTLHSLIERGFVRYIRKGKIRIYQGVEPKLILESYREKEKRFEECLPQLESLHKFREERQDGEIYEGFKGVASMLNELIEDTKPNDSYYFFAVDVSGLNEEIQSFFARYDAKRKAKRLDVKGLARRELKPLFTKRSPKMRYVDFPIPSNISICNDKMAFITWGEKPSGILITSKQIIQGEKDFFEELWAHASR